MRLMQRLSLNLLILFAVLFATVPTFAAGGTCPSGSNYGPNHNQTLSAAYGITSCFFVDRVGGSDSNTGTDETHAWAHSYSMPSATGVPAGLTPSAGEGFIFKGGVSWLNTDLGMDFIPNGTSSNYYYLGVDQTWFTGGSFTRPIFTCQSIDPCGTVFGALEAQIKIDGNYVVVDDIEVTGFALNSADAFVAADDIFTQGTNDIIENNYCHGWTRDTGAGGNDIFCVSGYTGNGPSGLLGVTDRYNVIDGQDSYNAGVRTGICIAGGAQYIYGNVCRYAFNGINGEWDQLHDNLIEHIDFFSSSGAHCNGWYNKGVVDTTANKQYYYNNVVRDSSAVGCVVAYNSAVACPTCTYYVYGNVLYNWPNIDFPMMTAGGDGYNGGTGYFYNNTISTDGPYAIGSGFSAAPNNNAHYANMHVISSNGGSLSVCGQPGGNVTCIDDAAGSDLVQTLTAANTAGYCEPGVGGCSATYPFAPSSGSSPTVGTGSNQTSNITNFGAPFGSDTTLGVSYNATNHTVSYPDRATNARPNAAWDVGAYQFTSGGSTVATPTFSPTAPYSGGATSVSISTATGGATLCFTTDGTNPTSSPAGTCGHGTTYSGPVSISTTTTLKAIGTLSGDTDSAVASGVYTIITTNPVILQGAGSLTGAASLQAK